MPELPEVEVVRSGIERWVSGRTIGGVEVLHPRAVRRHIAGAPDFIGRLTGRAVDVPQRRGKYLWLPMGDDALVIHLGMSGQVLMKAPRVPEETHLRVRLTFTDGETEMRFVDQRTFGGMAVDPLVPDPAGALVPSSVRAIARDPLDPDFDVDSVVHAMRRRSTDVKRALLDQGLVSGIGNIYADEALWRAQLHGRRPTARLTRVQAREVLARAAEVMSEALAQGGTSFDAMYVNVNGQSGYFSRSLQAYGQEGEPCSRCSTPIRRDHFMNRSSYFCPRCQPAPRGTASRPATASRTRPRA
jgi:formamidopyrimidine-DNA glycosylase